MTTPANAKSRPSEPDAEQICGYLRDHPEFFDHYPEMVAELRLSHSSGTAVSLVERQIQVLREQNKNLKNKLLELVDVGRENDRLHERMHRMTLDLLKTASLVELLDTLEDHLRNEFRADAIALHLPDIDDTQQRETGAQRLLIDDAVEARFPACFSAGKPQCGRFKRDQLEFLFNKQAAAIESTAVVPLGERAHSGLLAIGSREVNRFNPCMGTLFLSRLGELLSRLLHNHGIAGTS